MAQEVVEMTTSLIHQKQEESCCQRAAMIFQPAVHTRHVYVPPKKGVTSTCKLRNTTFRKFRHLRIKAAPTTAVWTPSANAFFDGGLNYLIR